MWHALSFAQALLKLRRLLELLSMPPKKVPTDRTAQPVWLGLHIWGTQRLLQHLHTPPSMLERMIEQHLVHWVCAQRHHP